MSRITAFVINLDASTHRLDRANRELRPLGVDIERVPAVDGRAIGLDGCPDYSEKAALAYFGRALSPGEVGCYMSHEKALRQFLQSDATYGLILEDDIVVVPEGYDIWEDLSGLLEDPAIRGWGFISVGSAPRKLYTKILPLRGGAGNYLCHYPYVSFGAFATLWSRPGAEAVLRDIYPITAPYDIFLRAWNARADAGYALLKPPFYISGVESDIESVSKRVNQQKLSSWIRRRIVEKPSIYRNAARFRLNRLLARG